MYSQNTLTKQLPCFCYFYTSEVIKLTNYGKSIRDFTYVSDIVSGVVGSLEIKTNKADVINLGGNNPVNLTYFIELFEKGLHEKADIELVPLRKGDVPVTYADVSKAKCLLGWVPKISIEDGMELFLEWGEANNASKYMPLPIQKQSAR